MYMNADNDLESQAIADVNELERADWPRAAIFVLLDRSPGYDTSNGDWRGTRLLRIAPDSAADQVIRSPEVNAPELGLRIGVDSELNLGAPSVLAAALRTARAASPDAHTALILWGHGSGWRAQPAPRPTVHSPTGRAFGLDETDDDALLLAELAEALRGVAPPGAEQAVSVVGMDLCYGAMVEVATELVDHAAYLVASEGVVPASGWAYHHLVRQLAAQSHGVPSPETFARTAVQSAAAAWTDYAGASISAVRLSEVAEIVDAHNELSDALYAVAADADRRAALREVLWNEVEDYYATPGDLNLDLGDLARCVSAAFPDTPGIAAGSSLVTAALRDAVVAEWHNAQGNGRSSGLAVHYCSLDAAGLPVGHDASYFRDYPASAPLTFVQRSSWVPVYEDGPGLLYRLWYEVLP